MAEEKAGSGSSRSRKASGPKASRTIPGSRGRGVGAFGLPAGPLMWAGPAITYMRPGFATSGQSLPRFLRRYIEACPAVATLLVRAGAYLSARKEVERVGSPLWLAAKQVSEALR